MKTGVKNDEPWCQTEFISGHMNFEKSAFWTFAYSSAHFQAFLEGVLPWWLWSVVEHIK